MESFIENQAIRAYPKWRRKRRHFGYAQPCWEIKMAAVGPYRFQLERARCR